jgi:hypothetical protein
VVFVVSCCDLVKCFSIKDKRFYLNGIMRGPCF